MLSFPQTASKKNDKNENNSTIVPFRRYGFSLLELVVACILLAVLATTVSFNVLSSYTTIERNTVQKQVQSLFNMAARQALLTDSPVSIIIRKDSSQCYIGYIVIGKNFHEAKQAVFTELSFHFPRVCALKVANEPSEYLHIFFSGRKGPLCRAQNKYLQKISWNKLLRIELFETSGESFTCDVSLTPYTYEIDEYEPFPDDLYAS